MKINEKNVEKNNKSECFSDLEKKYHFHKEKGKIVFTKEQNVENRSKKVQWWGGKITIQRIKNFLSIPFIYGMIIPAIILDIFIFVYKNTAMRLYGIPLPKRSDYIIFDRKFLSYLNILEKMNCIYCSYVNGLFSYACDIAGRTEKYWCPIKYANKKSGGHDREKYFADYGDSDGFRKVYC